MGGQTNTDRMDAIVRWMQANPGEHAASDIAVGIGDPSAAGGAISGSLMALSRLGSVSRRKTGSRAGVWSLNGGGSGVAQNATVDAQPATLVKDPWGDELTEDKCRASVDEAVKHHLDLMVKSDPKRAVREAFRVGAFLTGRPLPAPVTPAVVNSGSPVAAVAESDDPARLALPGDWTNDTLSDRLGKAERKGRFTYEAVAETAGMSADFVRRFGTGKAYVTAEHAERIYAAVADRI